MPSTQSLHKAAAGTIASSKIRFQNVTGDQTVKATAGVLHRIVVSNTSAIATLTLKDGAGTFLVIRVPVDTTLSLAIGAPFATSIIVNPSNASIDALCLYD